MGSQESLLEKTVKPLLSILFAAVLSSCAITDALNDHTLIAGIVAYKATAEVIELADDRQARAERILKYTDAALRLIDADTPVTLDSVYEAIHAAIDWDVIPPIDRPLVEDLLAAVRDKLAEEINQYQILEPGDEVGLEHVIVRIRSAAHHYS